MTQDIVHLARTLQLDALESEWTKAVQSPKPELAESYATAIDHLCDRDLTSRALGFAASMIEALAKAGADRPAMELGMRVIRRNTHYEAMNAVILGLVEKCFGGEDWFAVLKGRAGLDSATTTAALVEFDRLRRFTRGNVVYHGAGWGEGCIDHFAPDNLEVTVLFASGRRSAFPLDTLLSSFKSLDPNDLRAMKLLQMEKLQEEAKNRPAMLIRRTATLYRGTISSQQVKTELCGSVVPDKQWATWWKNARTAATKDPWLKVEGSTSRPVFVLRSKPVGLIEEATATLGHQNDLGQRIAVLREYLVRGQDEEVKTQILDLATTVVEQALAGGKDGHAHILDGILFLEEHGRSTSKPAAQELTALLRKADGRISHNAIDKLATQESREHAVALLPQALGDGWAELCAADWTAWPNSVIECVVDQVAAAHKASLLLPAWDRIAPYPRKFPVALYLLGKLYAEGAFANEPSRPAPIAVGRVLLHLGRILNEDRKRNLLHSRLLSRLTSLLTGKRGLLHLALDGISLEDMTSYYGIVSRAGEDFPQEIVDLIDRKILSTHPEILAKPELPFWEKDHVFTTAEGLRRIKDEYRVLVDEKIPANSKAIGAAAALGDLSENSEWESAMEEQRNLTSRAQDMDQQIRSAKLIEDQEIPDGVVAPGTKVTYVDAADNRTHTFRVLGPWDVVDDHTINYKAPVAQCLLGKAAGTVAEIPTPTGPHQVTIQSIERIV